MQLRHIYTNVRHLGTNALYDNSSSTAEELDEARAGEAQLHAVSGPASVPAGRGALRRYRQVAVGLALTDALCVVVALLASYAMRYPGELVPAREAVVIGLAPLVCIVVFYTFNLYAPQHLSAPEELRLAGPELVGLLGAARAVVVQDVGAEMPDVAVAMPELHARPELPRPRRWPWPCAHRGSRHTTRPATTPARSN